MNCDDELVDSILKQHGHDIRSLDISNNGIEKLSALYRLGESLQDLNLAQNNLHETSELSELRNLRRLDLRSNNITSINGLDRLTLLETLDLRWNKIETLQPLLRIIGRMDNLRVLFLEGNHICNLPEYPICFFNASNSLRVVDIWNSKGLEVSVERYDNPDSTPLNQFNSIPSTREDFYEAEIASMKMQIFSLESALKVQEKVISNQHKEAMISSDIYSHHSSQSSHIGGASAFSGLSSFCYEKLLNSWRKQCQSAFIKCQFAEKQIEAQSNERRLLIRQNNNMRQELEAKLLSVKEIQNKLSEKNQILQMALNNCEDQLKSEIEKNDRLQELVSNLNQKNLKQKDLLIDLCKNVEKNNFLLEIMSKKVMNAISESDARLLAVSSKADLIKATIEQSQLQLRNNWAEFELEKALFAEKPSSNKSSGNFLNVGGDVIDESIYLSPECESILRTVFKTIDTSNSGSVDCNVLHQVFQAALDIPIDQINCEESNFVTENVLPISFTNTNSKNNIDGRNFESVIAVVSKFFEKDVIKMMSLRLDNFLATRLKAKKTSLRNSISNMDYKHIDEHSMANFRSRNSSNISCDEESPSGIASIALNATSMGESSDLSNNNNTTGNTSKLYFAHQNAFVDITWGELLSILLRPNSSISHLEYYDLSRKSIYGDEAFSMIPLDLSAPLSRILGKVAAVCSSSSSNAEFNAPAVVESLVSTSGGGGGRLDKLYKIELKRLAAEREYLLERIQQMNRSMEKRVISIREFFEDELEKGKFRESKLFNESNEYISEISNLKSRIELLEASNTEKQKFYEDLTQSLRAENEELRSKMQRNENDYIQSLEKQLESSQNKLLKTETENNALLIESSKKDSKIKSLLRETLRNQSILTKHVEDSAKISMENSVLKESVEALSQEIAYLQEAQKRLSEVSTSTATPTIVRENVENEIQDEDATNSTIIEEMNALRMKIDNLVTTGGSIREVVDSGADKGNSTTSGNLHLGDTSFAPEIANLSSSYNKSHSSNSHNNTYFTATHSIGNNSGTLNKQTLSQHLARLVKLAEDAIKAQN